MKRRYLRLPILFSCLLLAASVTVLTSHTAFHHEPTTTTTTAITGPPSQINESILLDLATVDGGQAAIQSDAGKILNATLDSYEGSRSRYRFLYLRLPPPNNSTSRSVTLARLRLLVPNKESHEIPPASYLLPNLRLHLTSWLNRRTPPFADVMAELLTLIKRPVDEHYNVPFNDKPYPSCAVVGNSGVLLNSDRGAQIDSHDFVIRLNNARIRGFERDVGAKTSLSFVNSNILHLCTRVGGCGCHPYGATVPIVMYICQAAHFLDFLVCNSSHVAPLLITDARLDALCSRIVKYYSLKRFMEETGKPALEWSKKHSQKMFHYSSGMQAVVLALGICEKVSVFGFGKVRGAKHHYHTNQKVELDLHDYEAEYEFYRDLVNRPQDVPFLNEARGFNVPPVAFYK